MKTNEWFVILIQTLKFYTVFVNFKSIRFHPLEYLSNHHKILSIKCLIMMLL